MNKDIDEYYREKLKNYPESDLRTQERIEPDYSKVKKIHVTAVCGKAMAPLAGFLVELGYKVSGSDQAFRPPMSEVVEGLRIKTFEGFSSDNVQGADIVIVGNTVGPTNAEIAYCRQNNIPYISLAEALVQLVIKNRKSLVVTGTHGKTTTTGMLAHVLLSMDTDPGFIIGGAKTDGSSPFRLGETSGKYFVLEGDEYPTAFFDYAPKFLRYATHSAILTSIEHDHFDVYKTWDDYIQAFKFLIQEIPKDGYLIASGDDANVTDIVKNFTGNFFTYGAGPDNDYVIKEIENTDTGKNFTLSFNGEILGDFSLPMMGNYNVANATSVIALLHQLNFPVEEIAKGLSSYLGTKQRQEIIISNGGIVLIDDYAHHPTAVNLTLQGIKEHFPDKKLIAVFEPYSSSSRLKIFQDDYMSALSVADAVIVKDPPIRDGEVLLERIDVDEVVNKLRESKEAHRTTEYDGTTGVVIDMMTDNCVIVLMSSGAFGNVRESLKEYIVKKK